MRKQFQFWAGIVAVNAAAAVLAQILFGGASGRIWPGFIADCSATFVFSFCCSSLCLLTMPHVVPPVARRFVFPLNWAVIIIALAGFATIGNLAAVLILTGVGYFDSSNFSSSFIGSLKVSVIATLLFGSFRTATETLRTRLDATTLALRTKERDEAEARRVATEARLASLESRVQPHFLFNTLNSISALIPTDPAGAERMTGQLASLMRSSLNADPTALVRLDEELDVVRTYLDIERVRFGDRLRYTVDVPPHLDAVELPRLSLQTLVENSVKYAVAPRREGGSIAISASSCGSGVRLTIEDDGPGFAAADLPEGHGLALLRARLEMTFGDQATLALNSQPGRTTATVEIAECRLQNAD